MISMNDIHCFIYKYKKLQGNVDFTRMREQQIKYFFNKKPGYTEPIVFKIFLQLTGTQDKDPLKA